MISHFVKELRHRKAEKRAAAAKMLEQIGDVEAVPHLIKTLGRNYWVDLLIEPQNFLDPSLPGIPKRNAAQALGTLGDVRAVPHLIKALRDNDLDIRQAAAEALGKFGDVQAVPHLIRALGNDEPYVRRVAVEP